MNIFIVGFCIYPEKSPRAYRTRELVLEFLRRGHQVTLAIPDVSEATKQFADENGFKIIDLGNQLFLDRKTTKRKIWKIFCKCLSRLLGYWLSFPYILLVLMIRRRIKVPDDTDILISIAAPHAIHWGTSFLKIPPKTVWFADCGDPFMKSGIVKHHAPFYFAWLEKHWCRKCNYIVVPCEGAKMGYYQEFRNKIIVLPQGFSFDRNKYLSSHTVKHSYPIFIYAGNFYKGFRDVTPFLHWLSTYPDMFEFHIYSSNADSFIEPFKAMLGKKIFIHSPIERMHLLPILYEADFLVNIDNGTPMQMPSKLIDYAVAGRPVLNIEHDFSPAICTEFMHGNYKNKMVLPPAETLHINTIVEQIISLSSK